MTQYGFVLINTAPAQEHKVYSAILNHPSTEEIIPLFGEYDMIAKLKADDSIDLGTLVVNDIRTIKGVIDTKTMVGKGDYFIRNDEEKV